MRDLKTILDDYRKGTPEVRLNLFLFHRELRCAFSAIEKDEDVSPNRKKERSHFFQKNKKRFTLPFGPMMKRYRSAG